MHVSEWDNSLPEDWNRRYLALLHERYVKFEIDPEDWVDIDQAVRTVTVFDSDGNDHQLRYPKPKFWALVVFERKLQEVENRIPKPKGDPL